MCAQGPEPLGHPLLHFQATSRDLGWNRSSQGTNHLPYGILTLVGWGLASWAITHNIQTFDTCFFCLIICVYISSMSFFMITNFFLMAKNCVYMAHCTILHLSINLVKNILVSVKFWQLYVKLRQIFMLELWEHFFFCLLCANLVEDPGREFTHVLVLVVIGLPGVLATDVACWSFIILCTTIWNFPPWQWFITRIGFYYGNVVVVRICLSVCLVFGGAVPCPMTWRRIAEF